MTRRFGSSDEADSAGVPWAGRAFHEAPSDDDGSAPEVLVEAIRRFRAGEVGPADVVDVVRRVRLLVPLLAEPGELGATDDGRAVDTTQELSIASVGGPDGRRVLPAFSSAAAMAAWDERARPVPAAGPRVALAAAEQGTELVVLDPGSETEFALRRPAVWAIAQSVPWVPCWTDPAVHEAFARILPLAPGIESLDLLAGDPDARLAGPELTVRIRLAPGLDRDGLDDLVATLRAVWSADALLAERVDSMHLRVVSAA